MKNKNEATTTSYLKQLKTLAGLLAERESSYPCYFLTDRKERQIEMKKVVIINKEIDQHVSSLRKFEIENNIGVRTVVEDADELDDVIFIAAALLLLSNLSADVSRQVRSIEDVLSFVGDRDAQKCMLLREAFGIDKVLFNLVHFIPSKNFSQSKLISKEETFTKAIPSLSENVSFLVAGDNGAVEVVNSSH